MLEHKKERARFAAHHSFPSLNSFQAFKAFKQQMKRQLISARLATLAVVLLALAVSARASVEETADTYVVAKQDEPIEVEDETFSIPNFWGFGQVANEVSSELVEIMVSLSHTHTRANTEILSLST